MPTEPASPPGWRTARRFGWTIFALGGIGLFLCVGTAVRALGRLSGGPIEGNDLEGLAANTALGFISAGLAFFGLLVLLVRRAVTASRPSLAVRVGLLAGGAIIIAAAPDTLHRALRFLVATPCDSIEPTTASIVAEHIGDSWNCAAFGLLLGIVLGVLLVLGMWMVCCAAPAVALRSPVRNDNRASQAKSLAPKAGDETRRRNP
jgi:hypothetical protein